MTIFELQMGHQGLKGALQVQVNLQEKLLAQGLRLYEVLISLVLPSSLNFAI